MKGSLVEHEKNLNRYRQIMEIKERALKNLEKEFYTYQMEYYKYYKQVIKFRKAVKKNGVGEFTHCDAYLREFDDEEFKPSFLKSNRRK